MLIYDSAKIPTTKAFINVFGRTFFRYFGPIKNPCRNSMTVPREISKKSLFHVMWVGNILKTFIFYSPLVFKCHIIATTAIFGKIMKFFKKSEFFFVFKKKIFQGNRKSQKLIVVTKNTCLKVPELKNGEKMDFAGFYVSLRAN